MPHIKTNEELMEKIRIAMRIPKGMYVVSLDGDSRSSIKRVYDLFDEQRRAERERVLELIEKMQAISSPKTQGILAILYLKFLTAWDNEENK